MAASAVDAWTRAFRRQGTRIVARSKRTDGHDNRQLRGRVADRWRLRRRGTDNRRVKAASIAGLVLLSALVVASPAAAHGGALAPPPSASDVVLGWSADPVLWLSLLLAGGGYVAAVRRVARRHPANSVPRRRVVCFLAGLAAIAVALGSIIERYDTSLFSVHMVQHVLLTMVAAPLIALGAPITLALRVARPDVRRGVLLPALHSRGARVLAHPVVAWVVFAAVMWGSHLSPLFDAALEDPLVHYAEHGLFLGAALLFWWPVAGADPAPWRLSFPVRTIYLLAQMPQNTFLALAITSATVPRYAHYASLDRGWGPPPLADQQLAGGIMWIAGDLLFLLAIVLVVAAWMRHEDRTVADADRRADAERAAIRGRAAALADRRQGEGGEEAP